MIKAQYVLIHPNFDMIINKGKMRTVSAGKNKVINKVKKRVFLPNKVINKVKKRVFLPLKLKEEKANAPRVPVINLPTVTQLETNKELRSILPKGIVFKASI